jgi:hypothetical protein
MKALNTHYLMRIPLHIAYLRKDPFVRSGKVIMSHMFSLHGSMLVLNESSAN